MFRYVAIVWNHKAAEASFTAHRFGVRLRAQGHWQPAVTETGLQLLTTGTEPRTNGACPLPDGAGAILGKLFRRSELDRTATKNVSLTSSDFDLITRSAGQELVQNYWGRYIAIFRSRAGGVSILRDPSGALPCFMLRHHGVWVVFSWMEDILDLLAEVPYPSIDWTCVVGLMQMGMLAGSETALQGVTQVLPGELVNLRDEDKCHRMLWSAGDLARSTVTENVESASISLRQTVIGCVRSWSSCYDGALLRLSGGIDSSILLSCFDRDFFVTCLNYYSPGSNSDERAYARVAAAGAQRALLEVERDSMFRLERVITAARMPTPVNYVARMGSSRTDADIATRLGVRALFTGGGGDQAFFELSRWWPAADYLRAHPSGVGLWAAAMNSARLANMSVWSVLRNAIGNILNPAASRRLELVPSTLLRQEAFLPIHQAKRFLHPSLNPLPDLPIGKLNHAQLLLVPLGYYDPFERDAAAELVNPLLSQPLVELCLRLPTYLLTHGGRARGLARRAFAAQLPQEIRTRRSKGGMEEHLKAVLQRNLQFARAALLEGELARRGFLDRRRVEAVLSLRPTTFETHVGEIHRLIGIEVWAQSWSGRGNRTSATTN